MEFENVKRHFGLFSGISYLLSFIFITPILVRLDPQFDISLTTFDPLSQLGISPETKFLYNLGILIDGIFLYLYYSWYLNQSRAEYNYFRGWDLSIAAGKIAGLGQIGIALFFNIDSLSDIMIVKMGDQLA